MTFWEFADKNIGPLTMVATIALIAFMYVGVAWAVERRR